MKELDKNSNGNRRYLTEAKIVSIKDTTELGGEFYTNCRVEYFDTYNILRSLDTLMPMDEIIGKEVGKTYAAILTITSAEEYIHVVEGIYTINIKILSLDDSIKIPGSNKYLKRYKVESIIQDAKIIKEIKYSEALSQIIEIGQNYNVICIFDMDGFMDILQISKSLIVERLFPSITKYISSLAFAPDIFSKYTTLLPVKDQKGDLIFSSGNYAVVFKMLCNKTGKNYALKVFHRHQEGRTESYKHISKHINNTESPYLVHYDYCENEIEVDGQEYPALIMEWVEGQTLGNYLTELVQNEDTTGIFQLACSFDKMAVWLLEQPFAHGDLKTDNILIDENGTLRLIDYDGMFTPEMQGQHARENGSPGFRHPNRKIEHFNSQIDDFPILIISTGLQILTELKHLSSLTFKKNDSFSFFDYLLFSEDELTGTFSKDNINDFFIKSKNISLYYQLLKLNLLLVKPFVLKNKIKSIIPDISLLYNLMREHSGETSLDQINCHELTCNFNINRRCNSARFPESLMDGLMHPSRKNLHDSTSPFGYMCGKTCNVLIPEIFQSAFSFDENMAIVELDSKFGIINKQLKFNVFPVFDYIEKIGKLIFKVNIGCVIKKESQPGMDYNGDTVYYDDYIESYGGAWSIINNYGKILVEFEYTEIYFIDEQFILLETLNKEYSLFDSISNSTINDHTKRPYLFESVCYSDNKFILLYNGLYGVMNKKGLWIIPPVYLSLCAFGKSHYCVTILDGVDKKHGVIDDSGIYTIPTSCGFIISTILNDVNALFVLNNKYGIIKFDGTILLDAAYSFISKPFCEKYLFANINGVEKKNNLGISHFDNGKWGIIDIDGNTLIDFFYDDINFSGMPLNTGNIRFLLIPVKKDGKWGYINYLNQTQIDFKYIYAGCFNEDGAAQVVTDSNKTHYIRKSGSII